MQLEHILFKSTLKSMKVWNELNDGFIYSITVVIYIHKFTMEARTTDGGLCSK